MGGGISYLNPLQKAKNLLLELYLYKCRPELAWLGTETNQFGTDEFMKWCEELGAEPYLALNFGTGTLDEGMCVCNATLNFLVPP